MLPLALALFAIVLGGSGLYFGLSASQRLSPLSASMEAESSSAAQLEKEVGALQTRLAELSAQNTDLRQSLERSRIYANQNERTLKQLAGKVKENRSKLVEQAKHLNTLSTTGGGASGGVREQARSGPAAEDATASADNGDVSPPTAAGGPYTIQSGDTFAKIASKTGVSLQDLLDANPDANPRRLRIGQVIRLPK